MVSGLCLTGSQSEVGLGLLRRFCRGTSPYAYTWPGSRAARQFCATGRRGHRLSPTQAGPPGHAPPGWRRGGADGVGRGGVGPSVARPPGPRKSPLRGWRRRSGVAIENGCTPSFPLNAGGRVRRLLDTDWVGEGKRLGATEVFFFRDS